MKAFLFVLIGILAFGCSSEPPEVTDTSAAPPKPAEVKAAATTDDVILMAEYIVLSDLVRQHIDKPMNDTMTIAKLAWQVDITQPNAGAAMTRASMEYMHNVYSKAVMPMQQFAATARTPSVKRMADDLAKRLQQNANQYYRAMDLLKDPATVDPSVMQQVGLLMAGTDLKVLNPAAVSSEAADAARRTLGR